jgi:uncharacterized protein
MSRPKCCRRVGCAPDANYFKPRGIPSTELEEVILTLDEFEAIRLADLNGMYQEEAAGKMNISRQTFGRIIESAHKKISDVLINGKALKIEGGKVAVDTESEIKCPKCNKIINNFSESKKADKNILCPHCGKTNKTKCKNNRRII